MEWQKPEIKSYNEEELLKELQVKAFSAGKEDQGGGNEDVGSQRGGHNEHHW